MNTAQSEIAQRLEFAIRIALEAGDITLRYFHRSNYDVEQKSDGTPVTIADREAETHIRNAVIDRFSHDAILGEEFPDVSGTSGFRWLIDPIDGTKSFVHGVPFYGTMLGVSLNDECVAGVIALPGLNEYIYAGRGEGTWHSQHGAAPKRVKVSEVSELSEAVFCTTSFKSFKTHDAATQLDRIMDATRFSRTWGDCYGYVLVATGRADIMIDPIVSPWDIGPLPVILQEADGQFSNWSGQCTLHSENAVATNGKLHDIVLSLLAEPDDA